jgi:hypothetical protein
MRLVRSVLAVGLALATLLTLPGPASAQTVRPRGRAVIVDIHVNCVGDLLTGRVFVIGNVGDAIMLTLQAKVSNNSPWTSTSQSMSIVLDSRKRYPFLLNLAGLNARYYRVLGMTASNRIVESRVVRADSCEPGEQIPEATRAVLLPASMLLTLGIGGLALRRRRQRREDNPLT